MEEEEVFNNVNSSLGAATGRLCYCMRACSYYSARPELSVSVSALSVPRGEWPRRGGSG